MRNSLSRFKGWALRASLLAAVAFPPVVTADDALPLRLSAIAVNLSGIGRPGAERLEIVIERWSTDEEQKMLTDTLIEKRSDQLLGVVQRIKPRAGYIRTTTSLGWDVQFARIEALPGGGRRVMFLTDRPMSFFERARSTRSSEYEFMFCEMHLHPDGKGEGKLVTAAKVYYDRADKLLEIEDYALQPVRLTQVTTEKE